MQNIYTMIRQMFSGIWVDRNDGAGMLYRSPLRDEFFVPIAHKNHVRVNSQAECSSIMAFSVSYRTAVGPYTVGRGLGYRKRGLIP